MIRVFVGFDPREAVAFHVLSHSIQAQASRPVAIAPVALHQLRDIYRRPRDSLQSTDFSFSRFLVPHLSGYEGWAIYLDCDILFRDDIAKLWDLRDDRHAVMAVKHDYVPQGERKFLGSIQTRYEKKNWSSLMLLNNRRCAALTPDYVNRASGLDLHQFKWLESDDLIGALPGRWNHLVGEYPYDPKAAAVHFTIGGPYFAEHRHCDYAADWFAARDAMLAVAGRVEAGPA